MLRNGRTQSHRTNPSKRLISDCVGFFGILGVGGSHDSFFWFQTKLFLGQKEKCKRGAENELKISATGYDPLILLSKRNKLNRSATRKKNQCFIVWIFLFFKDVKMRNQTLPTHSAGFHFLAHSPPIHSPNLAVGWESPTHQLYIDRGLSADVSHFPWSINSREKICLPVVNRIIENEKIDWHDYKFMFHERRRVKMEHLIDQEKLKWIMRNAFLTLPPSFLWKNYCSRNRQCWACWNPLFYLLRKLCFRLTQILKSQSSTCCCRFFFFFGMLEKS